MLKQTSSSLQAALHEIQRRFQGTLAEGGVTALKHFPARSALTEPFPERLAPRLGAILRERGIQELYVHQSLAFRLAIEGKNVVVVTPTASGKTLCYNLPILNALVENPDVRALYLFPTKALAQDQLVELNRWTAQLGDEVRTYTYDGDTPQDARKAIRARGNLVLTNPEMLHTGILPHHTKWERLFEDLRYVVIDELHYYRGIFGSHLANVLRRLKRIAQFYGAKPQFICTSATIANPAELAGRVLEEEVTVVDNNGAPSGEKYFVFYNPPVVSPQLGIRRSYLNETRRIARTFLNCGLETIVFANSRLATEILVTYLKEDFARQPLGPDVIRGYRGGYLPLERREIERDLREGRLLGVVATSALELGIDIGGLDVAVLASYPGTIASTWQRAGRAGRRQSTSAAILVASSAPVDQFIVQNPDYFFGGSSEHAYVNPDNLHILLDHLKCAAFELPLREDETFGALNLKRLCEHLAEVGFLHHASDGWHWVSESYPADGISLRSVSSDNFVIVDTTNGPKVIGEVAFSSALTTLHEKAIYLQDGRQYHVERLDYDDRKAYVHSVNSEYFTDAIDYTKIKVLETFDSAPARQRTDGAKLHAEGVSQNAEGVKPGQQHRPATKHYGEVQVNTQVVGFKKIKFGTMENVGSGKLSLPEQEMHTTAYWLTVPAAMLSAIPYSSSERIDGVNGLASAMQAIATLLVMCDARDLGAAVGENAVIESLDAHTDKTNRFSDDNASDASDELLRATAPAVDDEALTHRRRGPMLKPLIAAYEPNIYLYDKYPGGVGLSEPLFRLSENLLANTYQLIANCPCASGCPSCVGPAGEVGKKGKEIALAILSQCL
jgi:DEAD/DEAH box helicase domain-containing protein